MNLLLPALAGCLVLARDQADIDTLIRQAMKAWQVPGAAVIIVRDDQVIYLRGHGTREQGKNRPVTPDTLFPLASCSKGFTSAILALLVGEGKLDWDDPVVKHLPWYRLSDPLVTPRVTIRDLLAHRTGLDSQDLLWYRAPWGAEESVRRLAHLPLAFSFRSTYRYQTTQYSAAGLVAAAAAKEKWESLLARRLFGPLGMKTAAGTSQRALRAEDRAAGHWSNAGRLVALPRWYPLTEPEPAGSVVCSVRDLGPWLRLHLGQGKFAGRQLIAASALAETHAPQMPIRLEGHEADLHPESTRLSYAMGWVVQDYRGLKLVSHAGIIEGFRSHLTLVPRARLGIAILANRHGTRMNLALSNALVDRLLGLKTRDWNEYLLEQVNKQAQAEAQRWQNFIDGRHVNTKPSLGLAAFAGTYRHPAYGEVKVALRQGNLTLEWRWLKVELTHFHFDVFVFADEFFGPMTAQFRLDRTGRVSSLEIGPPMEVTFRR